MWGELFDGFVRKPVGLQLRFDLFETASNHERLGLGEAMTRQNEMLMGELVTGLERQNKVRGNEMSTLVQ